MRVHTCTFVFPPISVFLSYPHPPCIVKMSAIEKKELKHMQVSATLLPFLLLACSCPRHLLPFVLLCALLLQCVVDMSWHVAKSPGHLSVLLSCPLHSSNDDSLIARGPLLPACHFSRCLTAKGRSQPASQPASRPAPLR